MQFSSRHELDYSVFGDPLRLSPSTGDHVDVPYPPRDVSTPARPLPAVSYLRGSHLPGASLRADEFDALMTDLIPKVRMLQPHLSDVEVLRAAARMAEYRLADERTLMDVGFHGWG